MAGKSPRRAAIIDTTKSDHRANASRKRIGRSADPVTSQVCRCPGECRSAFHKIRADRRLPSTIAAKQHLRDKTMRGLETGKPVPFACCDCRKSFKRRPHPDGQRSCPHCSGTAIQLDQRFKPPKSTDLEQWEKVRLLIAAGLRFQRLPGPNDGSLPYPETLQDAKLWLKKHRLKLPSP